VVVCDGPKGRTDAHKVLEWLASEQYLSLMIEAGSKVNWHYLAAGVVDKVLLYFAPKIMGGLKSLPVVGGKGRLRRSDALQFRDLTVHPIPPDEFYVEAYYVKDS
jgi:diaminohydroxyphosphoribosylaminopyrimidine deaminase/5-amino-6-(5-phosphoribosylamino)uracil reductase